MRSLSYFFSCLWVIGAVNLLSAQNKPRYTHADSLKGSYSPQRAWWDVLHYDLHVGFSYADSSMRGKNIISYAVLNEYSLLQLDLMQPLVMDSVVQDGKKCSVNRDGNAYFVRLQSPQPKNSIKRMEVYYHGKPRVAKNPPWEGGVVWARDAKNNPWISIACQGMAAQVWFPNKDHMADEPDSADIYLTAPQDLVAVSNGRFGGVELGAGGMTIHWRVSSPINNYNIIPYIGKYANIKDTLHGRSGILDLDYWVLANNYQKAGTHFKQVKSMLRCFEYWFGPYPFYKDGYKLVEAPYLGMEHQSAIAYGNEYRMGYRGTDLSQTGWGLKWDFIIVHESGHEWFGNNISAADVADNWIHESFTAYSENLYVEYLFGKQAGAEYVIGTRKAILNDKPMIGDYNVNRDGSGDVYYKGANLLHTIRQIVNNDSLWRATLTGLNQTFRYKTVSSKQIEEYMSARLGINLSRVFNQYLRQAQVPLLEYKIKGNKLFFRWTNCIKGFDMPLRMWVAGKPIELRPSQSWKKVNIEGRDVSPDNNYYIGSKLMAD